MNFFRTMLLLAAMTALFMGVGYLIGGTGGMLIALIFAAGTNAFAYWNSDKLALRMHHAEPVTRASAPELHEMVAELAKNAGLPMPKVYIVQSDQPNAFATGRNPENAAVAATTGLLRALDRREVAGVIAHELAHIKNRDTLTMTVAATVAGAISMLAQFGFFFGAAGDRERNPLGPIGVIAAVLFAPLAAMLIQMTISRTREYSADRLGAEISGDPLGLAAALRKIAAFASRIELPSAERNPASASMFIVNPLTGARMDNLFSTHPNVENRIRALEAMAGTRPAGGGRAPEPDPHRRTARRPRLTTPGLPARRAAAALIAGVLADRRSLSDQAGAGGPLERLAPAERARAQALAAGVLRHLGRIDALLGRFLDRPPPAPALNALRLAVAEVHLDGIPRPRRGRRGGAARRGGPEGAPPQGPRQRRRPPDGRGGAGGLGGDAGGGAACLDRGAGRGGLGRGRARRGGGGLAVAGPARPDAARSGRGGALGGAARGGAAADGKPAAGGAGRRSRRCRASPRAPGGCRTPPPPCRRGSSARCVAGRCSTSAPRPAARPCSSPPPGPPSPRSTCRSRGSSGCARTSRAPG